MFVSSYMHGKKGRSLKTCERVRRGVCSAQGEGLTVGDKPDRPARCDYHPLDPLSHAHTHSPSLTQGCTHLHAQWPKRECVARIYDRQTEEPWITGKVETTGEANEHRLEKTMLPFMFFVLFKVDIDVL